MRYIETILKLAFLAGSVAFMWMRMLPPSLFSAFMYINFLLGVTLIFNKEASYHFTQTPRDIFLRRIEGALLILFAMFMALSMR